MREYMKILEKIPIELKHPLIELAEAIENRLRADLSVTRHDFGRLDAIVAELAQAQKRTERTLEEFAQETRSELRELAQAQKETRAELKELAQAQKRTERTLEEFAQETRAELRELAQAQKETRAELKELAHAQRRTDEAVAELAQAQKETRAELKELAHAQRRTDEAVAELAQAQKRTEDAVEKLAHEQARFGRTFDSKIGGLGARWGVNVETSFRDAMRSILVDLGFQVERYLEWDAEGKVHGLPDQVELDVVIHNGTLILIEIKSSMSRWKVYTFERKIKFYEEKENKPPNRKLIISPFVDANAMEVADRLGMEVFTDINAVS